MPAGGTGLVPIAVPECYRKTFLALAQVDVYYMGACGQVNPKRRVQKRVVVVVQDSLYTCYEDGGITRCVRLASVDHVVVSGHDVVLKIPVEDHDVYLHFADADGTRRFLEVLSAICEASTGSNIRLVEVHPQQLESGDVRLSRPEKGPIYLEPMSHAEPMLCVNDGGGSASQSMLSIMPPEGGAPVPDMLPSRRTTPAQVGLQPSEAASRFYTRGAVPTPSYAAVTPPPPPPGEEPTQDNGLFTQGNVSATGSVAHPVVEMNGAGGGPASITLSQEQIQRANGGPIKINLRIRGSEDTKGASSAASASIASTPQPEKVPSPPTHTHSSPDVSPPGGHASHSSRLGSQAARPPPSLQQNVPPPPPPPFSDTDDGSSHASHGLPPYGQPFYVTSTGGPAVPESTPADAHLASQAPGHRPPHAQQQRQQQQQRRVPGASHPSTVGSTAALDHTLPAGPHPSRVDTGGSRAEAHASLQPQPQAHAHPTQDMSVYTALSAGGHSAASTAAPPLRQPPSAAEGGAGIARVDSVHTCVEAADSQPQAAGRQVSVPRSATAASTPGLRSQGAPPPHPSSASLSAREGGGVRESPVSLPASQPMSMLSQQQGNAAASTAGDVPHPASRQSSHSPTLASVPPALTARETTMVTPVGAPQRAPVMSHVSYPVPSSTVGGGPASRVPSGVPSQLQSCVSAATTSTPPQEHHSQSYGGSAVGAGSPPRAAVASMSPTSALGYARHVSGDHLGARATSVGPGGSVRDAAPPAMPSPLAGARGAPAPAPVVPAARAGSPHSSYGADAAHAPLATATAATLHDAGTTVEVEIPGAPGTRQWVRVPEHEAGEVCTLAQKVRDAEAALQRKDDQLSALLHLLDKHATARKETTSEKLVTLHRQIEAAEADFAGVRRDLQAAKQKLIAEREAHLADLARRSQAAAQGGGGSPPRAAQGYQAYYSPGARLAPSPGASPGRARRTYSHSPVPQQEFPESDWAMMSRICHDIAQRIDGAKVVQTPRATETKRAATAQFSPLPKLS